MVNSQINNVREEIECYEYGNCIGKAPWFMGVLENFPNYW